MNARSQMGSLYLLEAANTLTRNLVFIPARKIIKNFINIFIILGVVVNVVNSSTREGKTEGSLWV